MAENKYSKKDFTRGLLVLETQMEITADLEAGLIPNTLKTVLAGNAAPVDPNATILTVRTNNKYEISNGAKKLLIYKDKEARSLPTFRVYKEDFTLETDLIPGTVIVGSCFYRESLLGEAGDPYKAIFPATMVGVIIERSNIDNVLIPGFIESKGIAFVDGGLSPDTITDSENGFIKALLVAGDTITVSGSGSNDGIYTISVASPGVLTLSSGVLTAEPAGDMITISTGNVIMDADGCPSCHRRIRVQNDMQDWVVDAGGNPKEPVAIKIFQELGLSIDPKDIPVSPLTESLIQTTSTALLGISEVNP